MQEAVQKMTWFSILNINLLFNFAVVYLQIWDFKYYLTVIL